MPANLRVISQRDINTWSKIFPLLAESGFIKTAPANPQKLFVVIK
jgi:hypothetical protein